MPARIASMKNRIADNGQALHRARMRREAAGSDAPSEAETALIAERQALKEEREKRHAQALLPKPTAAERLLRTHHAQPKEKPKAKDAAHDAKDVKKPKARRSRAEKHAEQAAAIEAARTSRSKKPAAK